MHDDVFQNMHWAYCNVGQCMSWSSNGFKPCVLAVTCFYSWGILTCQKGCVLLINVINIKCNKISMYYDL